MKLGFITPNYPGERRVALLPEHIKDFENEIFVEQGFGLSMGIEDFEYEKKGAKILSREEIFKTCRAIFSLKLIQESDYEFLREGQIIVGWTHPFGSGKKFFDTQCKEKNLIVIDLDNITPRIFYHNEIIDIDFIPRNFIRKNSVIAGYAATIHAFESYGLKPDYKTKVAILSSGNVAQGAFEACAIFGCDTRMFYRKTMSEFYETISEYDVVINGIEVDGPNNYIINNAMLKKMKRDSLIIDAAADAGNAIQGTDFTTYEEPVVDLVNSKYYCINNTPSIFYRNASFNISESFSKFVYSKSIETFIELMKL